MSIFMLLMLTTVTPGTGLRGTVDEPGAMVMATGEPAATEPGAVVVTEVVMLDVWVPDPTVA
ncbi:hypothetical protein [Mycolicibacterium mucogenicum]|uniref:Uncharacterized protein n=1 Tax=Mycolicibacterium mucogenicum DSM 44124 TaxID=1226753 RepID=A0A8H2PG11_MYCMU|nr:hypothetical protein [Mycolicibacterium mucogenicum]KAB7761825.1 hypothetical protein MMUC44124_03000 [Mycolicibacterium mucogenicum DSM 44124]QPG70357.1 hypothetical protein C1S78_004950 [Mycolicibacterium mucogenicum DSM 44124]